MVPSNSAYSTDKTEMKIINWNMAHISQWLTPYQWKGYQCYTGEVDNVVKHFWGKGLNAVAKI